ncbi:MAG: DUF2807 domain-containing protein [Emcibacter sp.]|nr:DUF2807 domain-containing protein [Emcibacter sp.]
MVTPSGVHAEDITESRDLSSFDRIRVNGALEVDVKAGQDFSVTLKGNQKEIAKMTMRVEDHTLIIESDEDNDVITIFDPDIHMTITMPEFKGLEMNGMGSINIKNVNSKKVVLGVNGTSDIEVSGSCTELAVHSNGASNIKARNLKCDHTKIKINGIGNVDTYGSKSADLQINGIGKIDLYGNPQEIKQDKNWLSRITVHKK